MAGRGSRIHTQPKGTKLRPNQTWKEADVMERVFKLFPDAHEKRRAIEWKQQKETANRKWTQSQQENYDFFVQDEGLFAGELLDGKRNGYGIFKDQNGNIFQGEWLDNMKHGFFLINYSNGERFEGHFSNDKRNGEGTSFYKNGSQYHGDYKDDYRDGCGMFWTQNEYYTLQKLWLRKYSEGKLLEESEIWTLDQREAHKPEYGFGTYVDDMGRKYEGDFVSFQRDGKGRTTFPDGTVEIAEWKEDSKQGVGVKQQGSLYFYVNWKDDEEISSTPTDKLNFENYFWYDEGGDAQL